LSGKELANLDCGTKWREPENSTKKIQTALLILYAY